MRGEMYKTFNEELLRYWVMGGATVLCVAMGTILVIAMKLKA